MIIMGFYLERSARERASDGREKCKIRENFQIFFFFLLSEFSLSLNTF